MEFTSTVTLTSTAPALALASLAQKLEAQGWWSVEVTAYGHYWFVKIDAGVDYGYLLYDPKGVEVVRFTADFMCDPWVGADDFKADAMAEIILG